MVTHVSAEDDRASVGTLTLEILGRLERIGPGHLDVEQDDVGLEAFRLDDETIGGRQATDNVEVYGRAMFTYSKVPQQLAPTPIFQTASFTLDGNPFLTPNSQQILSDAHGQGVALQA